MEKFILQTEAAELGVGQIHLHAITKPTLRADRITVPDHLHPDASVRDTPKGNPGGYKGASFRRAAKSDREPHRSTATDDRTALYLPNRIRRKGSLAQLLVHPSSS